MSDPNTGEVVGIVAARDITSALKTSEHAVVDEEVTVADIMRPVEELRRSERSETGVIRTHEFEFDPLCSHPPDCWKRCIHCGKWQAYGRLWGSSRRAGGHQPVDTICYESPKP